MSVPMPSAEEDLAYLRRLVESDDGGSYRRKFGIGYLASGLSWGPYTFLQWANITGRIKLTDDQVGIAFLLTMAVMIGVIVWSAVSSRRNPGLTAGRSSRLLSSTFAAVGLTYLAVLAVLLWVSNQTHNFRFILVYAVVVFAGQGAAWYVMWMMQRRAWYGVVSLGWYACALAAGFNLLNTANFVLICAIALLTLMTIPGWLMLRTKAS